MRERVSAVLLGVAAASLVFALGAYGGSVAGGERGGFVMNFPATGEKVGGPSPRALTGRIGVSLDDAGVLKRLVQPNVIEISSHVVTNVGEEPYRIRFEAEDFDVPVDWHSRDRAWNPRTRVIERDIAPGEHVDVGVVLTFPRPLPTAPVLLNGAIVAVDDRTGERLSVLPVVVAQTGEAVAGACCE